MLNLTQNVFFLPLLQSIDERMLKKTTGLAACYHLQLDLSHYVKFTTLNEAF